MIRMNRILALGVAAVFLMAAMAVAGTRLIGTQSIGVSAPQAPSAELAPPANLLLVPDRPEKKEEKPMPPAVPLISEAVEKDGLSITLAPAKAVFGAKEPLAFVVTLKNESKEPFMLFDADWSRRYSLEIKNVADGGPWLPTAPEIRQLPVVDSVSKLLKPGATLEIKLPLDDYLYAFGGNQNMLPRPLPFLAPGKYSVRATRKFTGNPALIAWLYKHWVGAIATKPVEFTVAAQKPAGDAAVDKAVPDTVSGLSITLAPVKRGFETQEPLAFVVTLKNVSKEPFMLFDAEWAMSYALEIKNVADGGVWIPNPTREVQRVPVAATDSKVL